MKDFNHNPYNIPNKNYKNKNTGKNTSNNTSTSKNILKYQDSKFRIKVGKIESEIFRSLLSNTTDPVLIDMYSRILERWDRENVEFTLSLSASEKIHKLFSKDF
jgi:hypothetical protein